MNTYKELREKQQEEIDNLPLVFAFSNKQFAEAMQKLGLKETETDKIYKFGNTGGFYLKTDSKKISDTFNGHHAQLKQAIENDLTGNGFIYDMFNYELANHEYCITYNVEETLTVLDLTIEEVNANVKLKKALEKAKENQFNF